MGMGMGGGGAPFSNQPAMPGFGGPPPGGGFGGGGAKRRAVDWACDVDCVKAAAQKQGADVLTGLGNMKYSMDVEFAAGADKGDACGFTHNFPAFSGVKLNPSMPLKITTAQTRNEPDITFECEPGKSYHMILHDSLGGAFQDQLSYTHWMKLNMNCTGAAGSRIAKVAGNGVDMNQGTGGVGYLYPAFPFNSFHHFNFHIFETDAAFSSDRLATINAEFPIHNPLLGAWTLAQIKQWLGFSDPTFMTLQCPCNLAYNAQG
eukprot:gene2873-10104_t